MTVQILILADPRPDSANHYAAYSKVALPIMLEAGGAFIGRYGRIDTLVGDDGAQGIAVMEFPDETSVRGAFASPEYQATIPDRDKAFENFQVILTAALPS